MTARCALVAALVLFVPITVTVTAATARAATPSAGGTPALTIGADGLPKSAPSPGGAASGDTSTGAGAADATSTVPTSPGSTGTAPTNTPPTNTAPTGTPTSKPCVGPSPSGIYGATLTFTISTITPQLVTAGGPAALTVTGTMRNTGEHALSELGYKYQRGDALVGEAAIRNEVAQPCQPITVVDSGFVTVDGDLAAGASTTFQATVPIAGDPTRTLAVTDPGVYPIMINFNATVGLSSGDLRARVGEVHLLLTVLSVPPAPALPTSPALDEGSATPDATTGSTAATGGGTATAPTPPPASHPALPYAMVWTIVDRPHLGVGGIFLDDDLVPEISPGGRLFHLVSTMMSTPQVAGANTLAVDPELLDELDLMSQGYWVVAPPGTTQPPLTPVTNGELSSAASTASTSPGPSAATATAQPDAIGDDTSGSAQSSTVSVSAADSSHSVNQGGATATEQGATGGPASSSVGSGASVSAADHDSSTAASTAVVGAAPGQVTQPGTAGSTAPDATSGDQGESQPAGSQPAGTVPGTGRDAATAFLDQIRRLAANTPILVLPYSDPDAVALVRAGMSQSLSSSVYLGRAVASRVLDLTAVPGQTSSLIETMAYPVNGLADTATLSTLGRVGDTCVILAAGGVIGLSGGSSVTTVSLASGSGSLAALIPNSSLLREITPFLTTGVPRDEATTVNLIAGVVAGQYFADTGKPLLVVPPRSWVPNDTGVAAIGSLLAAFGGEGVVAGTDLRMLAAGATGSATVRYPASAKAMELPQTLLRRVSGSDASITSQRVSLTAVDGPDGGDPDRVLDPLQESLTRVASASLRDNRTPAEHVLSTVDSSLRAIEAEVTVPTSGGSLTLASSSAPLRLTVRNSLPYDVRLRIVIGGGQRVGLTTTDPGIQDIPAGRSVPVTVRAHVARSGTFSITAQLMTVDGRRWGAPVTLQVNSRAYGGLTLALLIVAGSVLVLMVVIRIVQRMRSRRARGSGQAGDPEAGGGEGPDGADPAARPGDSGETPLTALDPPDGVMPVPDGRRP